MLARILLFIALLGALPAIAQEGTLGSDKPETKKKVPLRQSYLLMNATLIVPKAVYPHELNPVEYMTGVLSCVVPPPRISEVQNCPNYAVTFYPRDHMDPSPELAKILEHPVPQAAALESRQFRLEPELDLVFEGDSVIFQRNLEYLFLPNTRLRQQWATKSARNHLLFLVTETCDSELPCRAGLWVFTVPVSEGRWGPAVSMDSVLIPLLNPVSWKELEKGTGFGLHQWEDRFAVLLPMAENAPAVAWMLELQERQQGGMINAHFQAHPVAVKHSRLAAEPEASPTQKPLPQN